MNRTPARGNELGLNRREFLGGALCAGAMAAGGLSAMSAACARTSQGSARRPNILILYSDQHNPRVLGCAGHPDVQTPHLDQLAAAGMRFERAYCQDGVCVPSRVSFMTGLYPRSTGVVFNGDKLAPEARVEPLAVHLGRNGYRTGAFGKRHTAHLSDAHSAGSQTSADAGWDVTATSCDPNGEPSNEYYWDWVREAGLWDAFERDWNAEWGNKYEPSRAAPMASRVSDLPPEATMEAWTARKAIDFIREAARGGAADQARAPFFCWASFYRPHQPYTPLPQYYALYNQAKLTLPASLHEPPENLPPQLAEFRSRRGLPWCLGLAAEEKDARLYRHFLACYYGCMTEIDHHIGEIMQALEESGQADNTIVIYTADHGDFATHHGLIEKFAWGHNIYDETIRVPFIVHWPGRVRTGEVRRDLIEQVDIYPTLLELAGVAPPADYDLPGRSLAPTLTEGRPHGRRYAVSENPYMVCVVGERYKLGAWIEPQKGDYPDMLFDCQADPDELTNLIGRPEAAAAEQELREAMAAWLQRTPNIYGKPLLPLALAKSADK